MRLLRHLILFCILLTSSTSYLYANSKHIKYSQSNLIELEENEVNSIDILDYYVPSTYIPPVINVFYKFISIQFVSWKLKSFFFTSLSGRSPPLQKLFI